MVEDLLDEILDHVAHQASSRERASWWEVEANRSSSRPARAFVALDRPPADVGALIGFCRSEQHRQWVEDAGRYNLRLGDRRGSVIRTGTEASAETVVLWCPDSAEVSAWTMTDQIEEISADELRSLGYPSDPSGRYLLRTLDRPLHIPPAVDRSVVESLTADRAYGTPVATTWASILSAIGTRS